MPARKHVAVFLVGLSLKIQEKKEKRRCNSAHSHPSLKAAWKKTKVRGMSRERERKIEDGDKKKCINPGVP